MTIQKLMDTLKQFSPNAEVVVCATEDSEYGVCNSYEFILHADRYLHPEGIEYDESFIELRYIK